MTGVILQAFLVFAQHPKWVYYAVKRIGRVFTTAVVSLNIRESGLSFRLR